MFEPRNRGVHKFELVEEKEAKHGYELAHLTVKNCVHHVSPGDAAIFYGSIVAHKGDAAADKLGRKAAGTDVFYFEGIGEKGEHAVLLDRNVRDGKIAVWSVQENGRIEVRCCKIRNRFSSEQIRHVFGLLERSKPKEIAGLDEHELDYVLRTLFPESRGRFEKRREKPPKGRGGKK